MKSKLLKSGSEYVTTSKSIFIPFSGAVNTFYNLTQSGPNTIKSCVWPALSHSETIKPWPHFQGKLLKCMSRFRRRDASSVKSPFDSNWILVIRNLVIKSQLQYRLGSPSWVLKRPRKTTVCIWLLLFSKSLERNDENSPEERDTGHFMFVGSVLIMGEEDKSFLFCSFLQ